MIRNLARKIMDRFQIPSPPPAGRDNRIPPELMEKIRLIQIKTNYLANDIMAGEYVSAFKGRGMEFTEVREYQPGDDARLIDWNVTARMDHPYIKEFREERELTMMLIVDVSSSGEFGSGGKLKSEVSAEIASILAFLAIKNNDKIGLIVFSDKIEHYIPPQKGKAHVWNVVRAILNLAPEGRGTDLGLPLEYLLKVHKRKTAAFFISDFQGKNYETGFKLAVRRHEIVPIVVSDSREFSLPDIGLLRLKDTESGETVLVDTWDENLTRRFSELARAERDGLKRFFSSLGVDTIEIDPGRSLVAPILQYFKKKERKR
ncbi:MAG: DUF58 domain-containing protein [Nitrospinae bacterium]|nr:DUF58 domain-containing protein [Nitrospinota bacterium]